MEHVSRVNQLDADTLDKELFNILKKTLSSGLEIFNSRFFSIDPELNAIVRILLFKYTVFESGATIGQKLLNLKYVDSVTGCEISRTKRILLAAIEIGFNYANQRVNNTLGHNQEWRNKVLSASEWLRIAFKMAAVLNFLVFLREGKYRVPIERLLKIRNGNACPQAIRQVQYEYMNRELLWHGFAEFITFVLPFINLHRIKNSAFRLLWRGRAARDVGHLASERHLSTCACCGESPFLPHDFDCPHVFCYYCIASNLKADPIYSCPICQKQVSGMENVKPTTVIH